MPKTARPETSVTLDHPHIGKVVAMPNYTFRINARGVTKVEISIDDSSWKRCLFIAGYWWYWWYDWCGYQPGKHQVHMQTYNFDGEVTASVSRQVMVY